MYKEKNADRFTGFADIYESARPRVPQYPVDVLCRYLGRAPETVVDLGCGTGLSTTVWQGVCDTVIGIEPSAEMLAVAQKKSSAKLRFLQAFSDDTKLPDACADIVVCSQSFHWMEPKATLAEVDRILKPGGVFATVDCDWPPVTKWEAERAYMQLHDYVSTLEKQLPDAADTFIRYPKEKHLQNIRESGRFRYVRELTFCNAETCTAERFRAILRSQGSLQTLLKLHPERIREPLRQFDETVERIFRDETFSIEFCYRMRIGIK